MSYIALLAICITYCHFSLSDYLTRVEGVFNLQVTCDQMNQLTLQKRACPSMLFFNIYLKSSLF